VALGNGGEQWCETMAANEPSLYWTYGISPSSLTPLEDNQLVTDLTADPNNRDLRRVAIARTMIWENTLSYRLDASGLVEGGTWRLGNMVEPNTNVALDIVHWADVDDNSWTFYFKGDILCVQYYEN
jgi:hypothetical protein